MNYSFTKRMNKEDLALNNHVGLICHLTKYPKPTLFVQTFDLIHHALVRKEKHIQKMLIKSYLNK